MECEKEQWRAMEIAQGRRARERAWRRGRAREWHTGGRMNKAEEAATGAPVSNRADVERESADLNI
jgi:hypothetical protein